MAFIEFNGVCKYFKVFKREQGLFNALKSLFHRDYELVKAVDDISFNIEKGELVGYAGPNGAGKSTTIKMLSGILVPIRGRIEVGGLVPFENRKQNSLRMGVVFGQRSQLYWDLPVIETLSSSARCTGWRRNGSAGMWISILNCWQWKIFFRNR